MKLTKSQLLKIISEELQSVVEAEEAWVLERSGVTFAKAFVKKGSSPSDPKFGSLGQAKTFKSKEAAKSFAAKSDIHVSVTSKESLSESWGGALGSFPGRYNKKRPSDASAGDTVEHEQEPELGQGRVLAVGPRGTLVKWANFQRLHDPRVLKVVKRRERMGEARKFNQMKLTKQKLKQIIKEELSRVLSEADRTFTFRVIEDEFDGGPRVDIEGIDTTFEQMIQDLEGKTLDFGDEPPFKFSISLFGEVGEDGAAWHLIKQGQAAAYIEMWAEMNGYEAKEIGESSPY